MLDFWPFVAKRRIRIVARNRWYYVQFKFGPFGDWEGRGSRKDKPHKTIDEARDYALNFYRPELGDILVEDIFAIEPK